MNVVDGTRNEKPPTIRTFSIVILMLSISCFAVIQYQHNRQLQDQLDKLTLEVNSRSVYDDELHDRIDKIIDEISDEPRLKVQDALASSLLENNGE